MGGQNGNLPRPRLHHVNLKTTRLDEMIAWYGKVLGTSVQLKFFGGAWLTNDEANHRVAFITAPSLSDDPDKLSHTGMHHLAFEFDSLDDLLATYSRLKADGIEPHLMLDHGMTTSFYYVDPDGNSVELQCDNFGDWKQSSEWMRTAPEFAANPIGIPIDPQKLVDARKAGTPVREVHRRAYAGEFKPAKKMDPRVPVPFID